MYSAGQVLRQKIQPHRIFTKETGAPVYLLQPTSASSHDNAMQGYSPPTGAAAECSLTFPADQSKSSHISVLAISGAREDGTSQHTT
ncbi:hypothetical protein LEMLEM_LOCUS16232 [Lemmus lemmus]